MATFFGRCGGTRHTKTRPSAFEQHAGAAAPRADELHRREAPKAEAGAGKVQPLAEVVLASTRPRRCPLGRTTLNRLRPNLPHIGANFGQHRQTLDPNLPSSGTVGGCGTICLRPWKEAPAAKNEHGPKHASRITELFSGICCLWLLGAVLRVTRVQVSSPELCPPKKSPKKNRPRTNLKINIKTTCLGRTFSGHQVWATSRLDIQGLNGPKAA